MRNLTGFAIGFALGLVVGVSGLSLALHQGRPVLLDRVRLPAVGDFVRLADGTWGRVVGIPLDAMWWVEGDKYTGEWHWAARTGRYCISGDEEGAPVWFVPRSAITRRAIWPRMGQVGSKSLVVRVPHYARWQFRKYLKEGI